MHYKVSRLILSPTAGKSPTTADVFIANPQIDQEAILGKLFLLCEIESNRPAALKIINFLINELPINYYQSEKLSIKEKMGTIKITEIFENALARTNAEFEKFLKKERIKIPGKSINLVTGVVYKNNLVFSTTGKIKALLIYPEKKDEEDKKIYKITPVNESEANKTNLAKIFSNITEGKIIPEGFFIFTNEILPEYISNKHLTKIITTLPPVSAIEQIKTQLHKINSYVNFLAVFIKSSATPEVKRSIPKMQLNVTSNNSLERMQETESETQKYLTSTGSYDVKKIPALFQKILNKIMPKKSGTSINSSTIRDKIFFSRKSHLRFLTKINYNLKNFFSYVLNILMYIFRIISHPKELWAKLKRLYENTILFFIKTVKWFVGLSTISKVWLSAFMICSILFAYSLYNVSHKKNVQVVQESYQELIQSITQKQNQIEASFIYFNEEKARQLIEESTILIKELEQYEKVDEKLINNFKQTNQGHINKISHVTEVNNPQAIANFNNLNSNADIKNIAFLNDQIFASDINNKSINRLNLADHTIHIFGENKNNIDFINNVKDEDILFISATGGHTINEDDELVDIDKEITSNINNITDIAVYNSRLYVLSETENNVYRYTRNYSGRQAWIKETLNIDGAVSIDVDGYIYILKNNGEILKLLSGYSSELKLSSVSPSLQNTTKLKLAGDSESGYIYILEPSTQRLVVFDKAGRFHMQYKIESLKNIKDFIVLEDKKKILLLNDNSIYEISAEHY